MHCVMLSTACIPIDPSDKDALHISGIFADTPRYDRPTGYYCYAMLVCIL